MRAIRQVRAYYRAACPAVLKYLCRWLILRTEHSSGGVARLEFPYDKAGNHLEVADIRRDDFAAMMESGGPDQRIFKRKYDTAVGLQTGDSAGQPRDVRSYRIDLYVGRQIVQENLALCALIRQFCPLNSMCQFHQCHH